MCKFVKGRELCRGFFNDVVRPILERYFPDLEYTAGLLGYGSDVLGYDDEVSTDHMWGPRFYLFLRDEECNIKERLLDVFSSEFPYSYRGYSVNFSSLDPNDNGIRHAEQIDSGRVNPLIFIYTPDEYFDNYIGAHDFTNLDEIDLLTFSEHKLLTLKKAEFYVDRLGVGERLRLLSYYPDAVWLYLLASNWALAAEEQAFVRRCHDVGDELGSRLACARIAERLMRLGFLYCREYAPYSKWFGTAFTQLSLDNDIKTAISRAVGAVDITEREDNLVAAQQLLARLHNSLCKQNEFQSSELTEPVSDEIVSYFGRKIKVIFADRIANSIKPLLAQTKLADLPPIGTLSEVADFTCLYDNPKYRERLRSLYTEV